MVFLSDYDMLLSEKLVQGVDVWLNMPRRPWEACGTSGMKVLVNGGLNLSELDGWWAEAYTPEVGWALGDGLEHAESPERDAAEADTLYRILEDNVVPEFYAREGGGLPVAWLARMRASMAKLTPRFSASRAVQDYTEQHYLPSAAAYHARTAEGGQLAQRIVAWQRELDAHWHQIRIGHSVTLTEGGQHLFDVVVQLHGFDAQALRIELFAEGLDGGDPVREAMKQVDPVAGPDGAVLYRGGVTTTRPPGDFTVRAVPSFEGVAVPLEEDRILWQR